MISTGNFDMSRLSWKSKGLRFSIQLQQSTYVIIKNIIRYKTRLDATVTLVQ